MCLQSIGTPKTINFPFFSKWKINGFWCHNIQAQAGVWGGGGGTNGKLIVLGVPIFKKQFRVSLIAFLFQ